MTDQAHPQTDPQPTEADDARPNLVEDEQGATTLEWALLLAAIAIPTWWTIQTCIEALVGHYQMMTMINSLPFP